MWEQKGVVVLPFHKAAVHYSTYTHLSVATPIIFVSFSSSFENVNINNTLFV